MANRNSVYSQRLTAFERKGHRALTLYVLGDQFLALPEEMRMIRKVSKRKA